LENFGETLLDSECGEEVNFSELMSLKLSGAGNVEEVEGVEGIKDAISSATSCWAGESELIETMEN
jgi:hypothetical protein